MTAPARSGSTPDLHALDQRLVQEVQAVHRAYRYGQTRQVFVYRFISD